MKKLLFLFLLCSGLSAFAQQAEVSRDENGSKVLKGFIPKQVLTTDTAFAWFADNQKGYTPNADAVKAFRTYKDSIHILAFGGTWCGDTKHILPQVYATMDAAGFSADRVTLLGVDRDKKTIQHLSEAFGVTNVPTFIILKDGKEVGRVVEYGRIGMPDKELGDLILKAFK